ALDCLGDIGVLTERLAGEDVRQMHLDGRDGAGKQSVEHGDRGMREGAGIDDQSCRAGSCLLNPRHQLALVLALPKLYPKPNLPAFTLPSSAHTVHTLLALDLRLPGP